MTDSPRATPLTAEEAPLDLDGLAELARAATPGPWKLHSCRGASGGDECWQEGPHQDIYAPDAPDGDVGSSVADLDGAHPEAVRDAAFIAAANPSTVLRLIDLARLGEAWQEAEEALPEGCRLYGLHKSNLGTKEQWVAACQDGGGWFNFYGPTPTAALQALAAKLREADR